MANITVKSLSDCHPEYSQRLAKLVELQTSHSGLRSQAIELERSLGTTAPPAVRPEVAALLGEDATDERAELALRLREVRRSISTHEAAIELQKTRVEEVRGIANKAACDAAKPEYGRRVAALAKALEQVAMARGEYREFVNALESEGLAWTSLTPFEPTFLGSRGDGHIERFLKEAKEAGYYA